MVFNQSYRCYPVTFIDKEHLENGDKILMPASALERLASDPDIDYPMLFELSNPNSGKVTHCSVLEFVADVGLIYVPYWMMQNMLSQEGEIVQLKSKGLEKGTYVKFQPHTMDFLDISNPKAALETALRSYSCLTTGDTIMLPYNNKKYYINIVETKPSLAVSIIDTDCEVDFAPPLDYVEPPKAQVPSPNSKKRVHEDEPVKAKFSPFSGSARRLDGKLALTQPVAAALSSPILKKNQLASHNVTKASRKLVFGSNAERSTTNETPKAAPKKSNKQEAPQKAEEPNKLQAFTGKKYTLNG